MYAIRNCSVIPLEKHFYAPCTLFFSISEKVIFLLRSVVVLNKDSPYACHYGYKARACPYH